MPHPRCLNVPGKFLAAESDAVGMVKGKDALLHMLLLLWQKRMPSLLLSCSFRFYFFFKCPFPQPPRYFSNFKKVRGFFSGVRIRPTFTLGNMWNIHLKTYDCIMVFGGINIGIYIYLSKTFFLFE